MTPESRSRPPPACRRRWLLRFLVLVQGPELLAVAVPTSGGRDGFSHNKQSQRVA